MKYSSINYCQFTIHCLRSIIQIALKSCWNIQHYELIQIKHNMAASKYSDMIKKLFINFKNIFFSICFNHNHFHLLLQMIHSSLYWSIWYCIKTIHGNLNNSIKLKIFSANREVNSALIKRQIYTVSDARGNLIPELINVKLPKITQNL